MKLKRFSAITSAVVITALVLAGCSSSGDEAAAPTGAVDEAAVALLPTDVKDSGKLFIGTDPTYAPNEYKDADGNPIGWEIELADAMAAKLGLKTEYAVSTFDNIIPGILGGKYQLGVSSFFDNVEREKMVDMVNYYTAGIQWAAKIGEEVDPDNACGKTLAVQRGTYQHLDDAPARSKTCTSAGKKEITILPFDTQDQAVSAVALGRADAFSADSPVTQYSVKQNADKLHTTGEIYEVVFYGFPVMKGSAIAPALQAALQSLVDDGTYAEILSKWGVESGGIDTISINGAASAG
jgi:polar amino acid transport system substrate-binding protein